MQIYLLRHGQTDWNNEKKLQGRTDIKLNETGIIQANDAAKDIKEIEFDVVFSSPLSRALDTAKIITENRNIPIIVDERLVEMSFGLLEGTKNYLSTLNIFTAPEKYVPGSEAESFEDVRNRAKSFLNDIKTMPYKRILIVSHGAFCRSLLCLIGNIPIKDTWKTPPMKNCQPLIIEWK